MKTTNTSYLTALFLVGVTSSCGTKGTDNPAAAAGLSASSIAGDSTLTAGIVNAHFSEINSAAADQGGGNTSLALGAAVSGVQDQSSYSASCASANNQAVVTIKGSVNKSLSRTSANGKLTSTHTVVGSSTLTRTWSRTDGSAVACGADKKAAAVNWTSPAGLVLDMQFNRQRDNSIKIVGPKNQTTAGTSFQSSGTRKVTWAANSTSADTSTSYFRNKSVVANATRAQHVTDKNGVDQSVNLSMQTKDSDPLVVQVERSVADNSLIGRTFVSGTMIANDSSDGSGRVETSYSNLKVNIVSGSCQMVSGSAAVNVYDSASALLKSYSLSVDSNGDPQLLDSNGTPVDNFVLDVCDPEDLTQ